ncbi:hypothetical protein HALLA_00855 (plasmid) [Halostagnicola larsenii XH-48]|uniref:Uncharacterized protein n=1 Tax=Halostagnicola larsenii XH-48 TaxID=797299 RepID=W0JTG9_9EURY|nr:hypothetical protein HALLA_00855 [Halostagnicola larsenii XH-48]
MSDRVDDLEATLEEKDDRIAELEAANEAFREQLSDYQEELERRADSSNPGVDETSIDQDDSIWTRTRRFVGDDN